MNRGQCTVNGLVLVLFGVAGKLPWASLCQHGSHKCNHLHLLTE